MYFFFGCLHFLIISKKLLPNPRSQRYTPVFSPRSFHSFSANILRSLIYFELILCMMWASDLTSFLHVNIHLPQQHFFEKTFSFYLIVWHPYWKTHSTIKLQFYFWTAGPIPLIYMFILCHASTTESRLPFLCSKFWNQEGWIPATALLYQKDCFCHSVPCISYMNFRDQLVNFCKKAVEILTGTVLNQ